MGPRISILSVLLAGLIIAAPAVHGRPRKSRPQQEEPSDDDASVRDSPAPLAPLPPLHDAPPVEPPESLTSASRDPAAFGALVEGHGRPAAAPRVAWIGRYDLTTSEPTGDLPENGFLASMVDTGRSKAGIVSIGDGLSRIVLTPIVTTARAKGPKDAVHRVVLCPFVCAIGVVTGTGQVVYGVLKTVTSDLFKLFKGRSERTGLARD